MIASPVTGFDESEIIKILSELPWEIEHITSIVTSVRGVGRCIKSWANEKGIEFNYWSAMDEDGLIEVHRVIQAHDALIILWNGSNKKSEFLLKNFKFLGRMVYIHAKEEEDDD